MVIIELHRTQTPFAVIVSNEIVGQVYSILYQDRYLRCYEMSRLELRWFTDNQYLFRKVHETNQGKIYEYRKFRKKISHALRHNFLVRNQIIKGGYI